NNLKKKKCRASSFLPCSATTTISTLGRLKGHTWKPMAASASTRLRKNDRGSLCCPPRMKQLPTCNIQRPTTNLFALHAATLPRTKNASVYASTAEQIPGTKPFYSQLL